MELNCIEMVRSDIWVCLLLFQINQTFQRELDNPSSESIIYAKQLVFIEEGFLTHILASKTNQEIIKRMFQPAVIETFFIFLSVTLIFHCSDMWL